MLRNKENSNLFTKINKILHQILFILISFILDFKILIKVNFINYINTLKIKIQYIL